MSNVQKILESIPLEIRTTQKCLCDDLRFAIVLTLLKNGEMSFSQLKESLDIQTNILSHHLKVLSQESLVMNYYAKRENTMEYSFYDVTPLSRDCVDRLFALTDPIRPTSEALARLKVAGQNYAEGLGMLIQALEEYGGNNELRTLTVIKNKNDDSLLINRWIEQIR